MRFISSYQGEAHYEINGKTYHVRTFADPKGSHKADYWPTVLATVGTVRAGHWPEFTSFPPAEVVAMFPGFIGARYDDTNGYAVVYDGPTPQPKINRLGWTDIRSDDDE